MKRRISLQLLGLTSAIACASALSGCHSQLTPVAATGTLQTPRMAAPAPPAFIYKMKADYSQLVPVMMDKSRSRIVSYPAPSDLRRGNRLATPTPLDNGFWLDNRGIGETVAFLSYTYEEYAAMEAAPSMDELMKHIIERYPLTEFHYLTLPPAQRTAERLNEEIRTNGW